MLFVPWFLLQADLTNLALEVYVSVLNRAKGRYALKTTASDVLLIGSHLLIEYDRPRLDAYKTLWPETLVVSFEFCL